MGRAEEGVEGSGPWGWDEKQERRTWRREDQMGKGSADNGSVRNSVGKGYEWPGKGELGCSSATGGSAREEG